MNKEMLDIKGILIQDDTPTPDNPVEIKQLIVNKEAEEYIEDLQKENEKLNNIINELEKFITKHGVFGLMGIADSYYVDGKAILNKLKELKENKQ